MLIIRHSNRPDCKEDMNDNCKLIAIGDFYDRAMNDGLCLVHYFVLSVFVEAFVVTYVDAMYV